MQNAEFNPWEFNPLSLKPNEVSNPLLVLADFFSGDWLAGHFERLRKWRKCILEDVYYKGVHGSPAELLYFHKLNISLIEATRLLMDKGEGSSTNSCNSTQLEQEKSTWREYPANLSEAELIGPDRVITDFFTIYNLPQYRSILYEWMEHGLSAKASNEFVEAGELIAVYENLQKLYSAAWLIYQRTAERPYFKDMPAAGLNPGKEVNSATVSIYALNKVIPAVYEELISKVIAVIKYKVPSVRAVFYLGVPPMEADNIFLLILTSNDEQRKAQSLSSTIAESCRQVAKVTALVHHANEMSNAVDDNNLFFCIVLRCPVIFLSGEMILPVKKPFNLLTANNIASANWQRWQEQGREFLSGAEFYLEKGAVKPALFSLHQCVECLLIAIIRAVSGYRVNNHNLFRLLAITKMFTPDLIAAFDLENTEGANLFDLLKHAYINVRYKDNFEPDVKSGTALYQITKKILLITEKLYQQHLLTSIL